MKFLPGGCVLADHGGVDVVGRALASKGTSGDAIYSMLRRALTVRGVHAKAVLLDVGCGTGALHDYIKDIIGTYSGADVVRYPNFPPNLNFHQINLDAGRLDVSDSCMDVVASVETIEHLENPRALVRELVRVAKPGGVVIVTTPNNLSFLSKLTLVLKNEFNAFQAPCYPAHITALLESDLRRIFNEAGLKDCQVMFSNSGRVPGFGWHWRPQAMFKGRMFSDNILVSAVKPN